MSILPEPKTPWPPSADRARYERMRSCSAWYGGDPARLASLPGGAVATVSGGGSVRTTINPGGGVSTATMSGRDVFWGARNNSHEVDTRRHLPVAQDIAALNAELLFSEAPFVSVDGPREEVANEKGQTSQRATIETRAAQQRLEKVLDRCNFHAVLMAGAEIGSALGSTGLRIAIDKTTIPDRPVITRVDADAIIPRYSWGQLTGVLFWHVVKIDRDIVYRHIEAHERGEVQHALYKGTGDNIGERIPLATLSSTAHLAPEGDPLATEVTITIDRDGGKTATSIPNMLPDPLDRHNNVGRSDYTPSVQGLFDDIDRVYTQMMESIDDAKSRLIIGEGMLDRGRPGSGVAFNQDQRIFTQVKLPPAEKESGGIPIEKVQFDMRVAEYLQALDSLVTKATEYAGYTADTERDERGAPMTATEYQGRNQRSMRTRGKKMGYWHAELEDILTTLLRVDVAEFGPVEFVDGTPVVVKAYPVLVEFPHAVQPTLVELAETARALRDAEAASKFTLVKTVHPDWDDTDVQAEVDRMLAESAVIDPVTFRGGNDDSMLTPPSGMSVEDARTALDALGVGVRAGAEFDEVAKVVGLDGLKSTGATPSSLRLPESEAAKLEEK